MIPTSALLRDALLGLSFFVVGVALFMCGRHVVALVRRHRRWDVWFLLIYAGLANIVALIAELLWGVPGVPVTAKAVSYAMGLLCIGVGTVGAAYSTGRRDKRASDHAALSAEDTLSIAATLEIVVAQGQTNARELVELNQKLDNQGETDGTH